MDPDAAADDARRHDVLDVVEAGVGVYGGVRGSAGLEGAHLLFGVEAAGRSVQGLLAVAGYRGSGERLAVLLGLSSPYEKGGAEDCKHADYDSYGDTCYGTL